MDIDMDEEFMVGVLDSSVSSSSSSSSSISFFRTENPIDKEHTIVEVFEILSKSTLEHLFRADTSRGLESAIFKGKDARSGEIVRNEERNCAVTKWGKATKSFGDIYNITFKLHQRHTTSNSSESNTSLQTTPKFSLFLNPKERSDSARKNEINEKGLLLPFERSAWENLQGVGKFSLQPYVTKRWDAIVRLFFDKNDIKYSDKVVNDPKHHIYVFIMDLSELIGKLNYRFNKIVTDKKFDIKNCPILGPFFEAPSRSYSNSDENNKIDVTG